MAGLLIALPVTTIVRQLTTCRGGDKKGEYIAGGKEIRQMFTEVWSKIYMRHPRGCFFGIRFKDKYGESIPRQHVEDFEYTVEDFNGQLDRMKESPLGFDGWARKALRTLPREAWHDRARIEHLANSLG